MTCPAGESAHARVSHLFHANCKGCAARAVARGRVFARAQRQGVQDSFYRRELQQNGVTHADVLAERDRDFMTKERA